MSGNSRNRSSASYITMPKIAQAYTAPELAADGIVVERLFKELAAQS